MLFYVVSVIQYCIVAIDIVCLYQTQCTVHTQAFFPHYDGPNLIKQHLYLTKNDWSLTHSDTYLSYCILYPVSSDLKHLKVPNPKKQHWVFLFIPTTAERNQTWLGKRGRFIHYFEALQPVFTQYSCSSNRIAGFAIKTPNKTWDAPLVCVPPFKAHPASAATHLQNLLRGIKTFSVHWMKGLKKKKACRLIWRLPFVIFTGNTILMGEHWNGKVVELQSEKVLL